MKKVALFIGTALLFLLLLAPDIQAATIPQPEGHIYTQDFANLLTEENEAEIDQMATNLESGTGAQIAVLTVDSMDGSDIQSYANQAFRTYQLGDAEKNNGVLLVIDMETREMWVEVGYGLEGALPDGKVGRILDEFTVPYMKNDQYDQAIINTMKVFYQEIAAEYDWNGEAVNPVMAKSNQGSRGGGGSPSFFTILIIAFVLYFIFKGRGGGGGPGSRGRRRGGFMIFPGFGGGFGGGGFGGGGGGFTGGGGGSSGGGGAGRGF